MGTDDYRQGESGPCRYSLKVTPVQTSQPSSYAGIGDGLDGFTRAPRKLLTAVGEETEDDYTPASGVGKAFTGFTIESVEEGDEDAEEDEDQEEDKEQNDKDDQAEDNGVGREDTNQSMGSMRSVGMRAISRALANDSLTWGD